MTFQTTPVKLCELAGTVTELASGLRDELAAAREKITLSANVFGNSSGAGDLGAIHDDATSDAASAVEAVAGVLEGDVDRLYRIAFAVQHEDQTNAADLRSSTSNRAPE